MRIIGGRYRGHRLVSFQANHIRPTTDRVKETLFNILMGDIESAQVLDLFSGTGNLGIEALSRDADGVTFVEKHRKSLSILKQNLEKLKIEEGFQIFSQDVESFLRRSKSKFDIIFIDPPFTEKMAHPVMELLAQSSIWHEETLVAIESAASERMDERYGDFLRFKNKNFGDKILSVFSVVREE